MPREIRDGVQNFATFRENDLFYIDKTDFLRQWWLGAPDTSEVSLITRPRRFGKTLMLSTVEHFFSSKYAGRSDLFEGLDVWQSGKMREQQGKWPVIFLSLSSVKGSDFASLHRNLSQKIADLFTSFRGLKSAKEVEPEDLARFSYIQTGMRDGFDCYALNFLCDLLNRTSGKQVILLLDEYDTPLLEAWLSDCWTEATNLLRTLYNAAFKGNLFLKRAIVTGITRVSKESIFSDLNNLGVYSVSTPCYETSFGFTEAEVFAAMDERGLTDRAGVKAMYDGYIFGKTGEIYNPWSVTSYLKDPRFLTWWANTSSNALVGKLVQQGSETLKKDFQTLLEGGSIESEIDEQIVFDELGDDASIWSLLLASGYLKPDKIEDRGNDTKTYTLSLPNGEIRRIMAGLVKAWFKKVRSAYGNFLEAFLGGNLKYMNRFMNDIAFNCFSSFDTGNHPSQSEPERFYHGFVLGLLVELRDRYILTSNRESGFGRYDVMLEPRKPADPAFVLEFKVHDPDEETDLKATVAAALAQIKAKGYEQQFVERGIPADRIHRYGFAFRGREVLIGQG